mmetsp:Transcript_13684/g.34448  ORF Transcript_13684/g.34448 Transcript_13684/m.34448 type:complete len:202 (+) Transcript_13684:1763-2368(+)
MLMLSVFRTPWQNPTACQLATSLAVRRTTSRKNASTISRKVSAWDPPNCLQTSGKCFSMVYSSRALSTSVLPLLGPSRPVNLSLSLQISNEPNRRKVGASLRTTLACSYLALPSYIASRMTVVSLVVMHPARVVGIPRACKASLPRNSRSDDRSTFLPSACLLYFVGPDPLSCSSHPLASPRYIAAPSPSCPLKCPNWYPQ